MRDTVWVSDLQIKPGLTNFNHVYAAANMLNYRRPPVIVIGGDWWDFPSLALKYITPKQAEGKRVVADLEIGNRVMKDFLKEIKYKPEIHFLMGNHEDRLEQIPENYPYLEGIVTKDDLYFGRNVIVHDFLEHVKLDGVTYSHYFTPEFSFNAMGGRAVNQLRTLQFSFTAGHKQIYDHVCLPLQNGAYHNGLICGAFYKHKEHYKKGGTNNHFRGLIYKHGVHRGHYDIETISIRRLEKEFGG